MADRKRKQPSEDVSDVSDNLSYNQFDKIMFECIVIFIRFMSNKCQPCSLIQNFDCLSRYDMHKIPPFGLY